MRPMLRKAIQNVMRQGTEWIDWCEGYADGTEAPADGILVGNWNPRSLNPLVPTTSSRIAALIERDDTAEVELEWSDTIARCDRCQLLIQTEAQHLWDHPHYWIGEGSTTCERCTEADPEPYVEYLTGRYCPNNTAPFNLDWNSIGFTRCETKLYDGDWGWFDRVKESAARRDRLNSSYIGLIDEKGYLWIRPSDYDG